MKLGGVQLQKPRSREAAGSTVAVATSGNLEMGGRKKTEKRTWKQRRVIL